VNSPQRGAGVASFFSEKLIVFFISGFNETENLIYPVDFPGRIG
jgi:hypothetical protein